MKKKVKPNNIVLSIKITRIVSQVVVLLLSISLLIVSIVSITSSNDIIRSFDAERIADNVDPDSFVIEYDDLSMEFDFPLRNYGKFALQEFQLYLKIIIISNDDSFEILNHYTSPETIKAGEREKIDFSADFGDYNLTELERLLEIAGIWFSLQDLEIIYGLEFEVYLGFETEYSWGLYSFDVEVDIREVIGW